jgi:hypothetical protein
MNRSFGKIYLAAVIIGFACLTSTTFAQNNNGFRLIGRAVPGEASATSIVNNRCYLGAGNCLQVYDITTPASPSILGQLSLTGMVEDVVVRNNLAYIADGPGGLIVADVSSPTQIQILGQLAMVDEAFGIQVQGNYGYVAGLTGGFVIVDLSNPVLPVQRSAFAVDWAALNVDVRDTIACVACGYGGLYIINIANPDNPLMLGLLDTQDTWAYDVKINGSYAYMAYSLSAGGGGLKVVNISNYSAPQVTADLQLGSSLRRIDYAANNVFAACAESGMLVIEVNNPTLPRVMGGWQIGYGKNISFSSNIIYLSGGKQGLRIFNASNIYFPQLVSTTPTYSLCQDVTVLGQYAYVVEQPSGLKAINISNLGAPRVTYSSQFYFQNNDYRGVSSAVSVKDGRLYVSDFADMEGGQHDFRVYGLADPSRPETLGVFRNLTVGVRGHAVSNDVAYLSNSWAMIILDVRNPYSMQLVNTFVGGWDFAYGISLTGNYIYAGTMETGLKILDITNQVQPIVAGSFDTPGQTFTAKYHNGYAYLPDYDYGLRIVNVENPTSPYEVSYFNAYEYCLDVAFIDKPTASYAIVDFDDQIVALNITDPANPVEVGHYETGDPRRLCTRGDTIYVADRNSGLYIFVLDVQGGIADDSAVSAPKDFVRAINYPNPFNPSTTIEFEVPSDQLVKLEIFDVLGRSVSIPLNGVAKKGINRIIWNGDDYSSRQSAAGVYFYRLTAEEKTLTGKMIFAK